MLNKITSNIPFIGDGSTDDIESEANEAQSEATPDEEPTDTDLPDSTNSLTPEEVHVYKDEIILDGTHARTYAINKWPPMMNRDIFTGLITNAGLDYEFKLFYDPYDNISATDKLESLETKLADKRGGEFSRFTSNKESIRNTEETVNAMKQHITQGERLLDLSFLITIYADSRSDLENFHETLNNILDRGAQVRTNKCVYQQQLALRSNTIAAENKIADKNDSFKQLALSDAASKTFPFIEDTFMEPGGVFFGINENSMTPIFIDVFDRSNGFNMLTTGMIGSGKSFSSSQILMELDISYKDFRQFIIDPMGGFLGVNNALDGDRIILNGTESINPMEIKETPEHVLERSQGQINPWSMKKEELRWFFTQFFMTRSNERLSNEELSTLDTAITQTYHRFGITEDISTHSKESPTILDLIETLEMIAKDTEEYTNTNLQAEIDKRKELAIDLLVALDPFKEGGEYHNLAQKTDIDITDNRTIYLDLQQISANSDDLGIMMQLLFMKLYQKAKSTTDKVALTIDEAHKIMGDKSLTSGLEEMFRHSRHFDLSINLISQTPEEFYSTETARAIANQCTIKRFHRVDHIDGDLAEDTLDMNPSEINYIEDAEMGEGDKDYSQALLTISDEDRSLPLRIKATRDEQMIIDYDPTENIEDFTQPSEQRLKQALDTYNTTDKPRYVGDEEELTTEVKAQLARKERARKRVLQQQDPSLVNGNLDETAPDTQGDTPNENTESTNESQTSSAAQQENESVGKVGLKRRLGDPSDIDSLDQTVIEQISHQYEIADDTDDLTEKREAIKADFFPEEQAASQ